MGKVICISNHKGGVGKTTTTINLGAALSRKGYKVLAVDMDAQANLTTSLGVRDAASTIYGALRGRNSLEPIMVSNGFDIIASELDLSGAEIELASEAGREFILKELIEPMRNQYDYILIDTPPSLGLLTLNSFTAADEVIITLQAEYLALQGLGKLNQVLAMVRSRLNKSLKLSGVVVTQYDARKTLNRLISEQVEEAFRDWDGCKVYTTKIRDNVALAEAPTQGIDIFRYDEKSRGAKDYASLADEFISLHK